VETPFYTFAANSTLTKAFSLWAGHIGLVTATWATIDKSGPAYRVTIPAVIYTIMLRRKYSIKPAEGMVSRIQNWLKLPKK
jgi:uncharacterized protein YaaW (UPF0174 family)